MAAKILRENERKLWMFAAVLLLSGIVFLLRQLQKSAIQSTHQTVQAQNQQRRWQQEKSDLLARLEQEKSSLLPSDEVNSLKRRGLAQPASDLIANLQKHPDLIRQRGVLGGKMGFYDADAIHILGRRWALATFDDGHISGQMLLRWNVSPRGAISWKVMDSYLD